MNGLEKIIFCKGYTYFKGGQMFYFYVALFGGIGALARYWISITLEVGNFAYNTLLINVFGCFFLAITIKYLATLPKFSKAFINGLGTGLIGSFTTFSTFSVQTANLILNGKYLIAMFYVLSSIVGGFLSAALGVYVSNRLIARRELKRDE
jgi:CrcB protein